MKIKRIGILSGIVLVTLVSLKAQNISDLSDAEKIYGLSLLWKEASDHFAYFELVPEIQWDETYKEYLIKVQETESLVEYYNVLTQFLALLRDGHTRIIPPQEYSEYYDEPKIKLLHIHNKAVVQDVGVSLIHAIPIGSCITEINDIPVKDYLVNERFPYICCTPEHIRWTVGILQLFREKKGTDLQISYVTPSGEEKEITLECNSRDLEEDWAVSEKEERKSLESKKLEDGLSYISINTCTDWSVVEDFKALIPDIQKSKGVIFDVRNNGGGDSDISNAILKYFIDQPIIAQRWKTRDMRSAYKAWGKWTSELPAEALEGISEERKIYLNHFRGTAWYFHAPDTIYPNANQHIDIPVAVLANNLTASAAEHFVIGSRSIEEGVSMGERTAGFPGIPLFLELPGGGFGMITTTQDLHEDGSVDVSWRNGIEPEIKIQPTVEDIVANRDPVLEKAIEVLTLQSNTTGAESRQFQAATLKPDKP